jgi:hypothetical protein
VLLKRRSHRRISRNRPPSPVVISVEATHPNLLTILSQAGVSAAPIFVPCNTVDASTLGSLGVDNGIPPGGGWVFRHPAWKLGLSLPQERGAPLS